MRVSVYLLFITLGVASLRADVMYNVIDLGSLGGWTLTNEAGNGLNASGEAVGTAYLDNTLSVYHAFLYGPFGPMGQMVMKDLGASSGTFSAAYGVNASGDVVGWWSTDSGPTQAFVSYSGGPLQDLAVGGTASEAFSINNSGDVVGYITDPTHVARAFLLSSTGPVTYIDLGGTNSRAYQINNAGEVVGYSTIAGEAEQHAFLYSMSGGTTDLGTLGGDNSIAYAINDSGHVVGSSDTAGGSQHAFLDINGNLYDLGTLGGSSSRALGINNLGVVVGAADAAVGTDAFVCVPDPMDPTQCTMSDLNSLVSPSSGWFLGSATAINDAGQIVGTGFHDGRVAAFLLTPVTAVPEPNYGVPVLLSMAVVLALKFRKSPQAR